MPRTTLDWSIRYTIKYVNMYRKKYFFMCYMLIFRYMTLTKRAYAMNPKVIHFVVNHV